MGIISGAANLYFIYRFLRILTTAWEDSDAFKLGIIDEKGKILKKKSKLRGKEEKEAYTMMHRFVWKLKRLLEKIPFGKSRMASYAAALWLIKEEKDFHGTDAELQESFLSFLETDWKDDALILKENYEGDMDKKTYNNLNEGFKDLPPHLQKSLKDYAKKQKKLAKSVGVKVKTFAFNPKTGKPDIEIEEKAPPGWEGTVKAMKKKKGIDNPYSLAWYMKNKGDKSRIPEEVELDEASKSDIQSFGKKLSDYAKKSGGIDKDDFKFIAKEATGGHLPNPKSLSRMDTEPREVVLDLMAKEFGRKFVEKEYKTRFTNPKNYKEWIEVDEGWKKGKYKVTDGKTGKVLGRFNSGGKAQKYVDDIFQKGDYESLTVELDEKVVYARESTKEYAKSLEKMANDKKMSMLSKSEKRTLLKIADMLAKERKEGVEIEEDRGDDEHKALVQFKARWLMKQVLKGGKRKDQAWWNKQARIAGFAKGADAVKVLTTILDTRKEEVEIDEAVLVNRDYKYDGKVIKISRKNFSKVHRDFKGTTKGKETMITYDSKEGTVLVPVEFTEEVKDMAGEWGTDKLTNTFKNDTPGQKIEEKTKEREISHKEYLKHGAGKGGKQWTTGSGKNTKFWTHRKEEVEWSVPTFSKFITEGRPAGKIRGYENTATNVERQKLVDSQEKNYTLKDIESIARKHKVRLNPVEPPMKFGPEWTILTDKGISLIYDKRENATEVTGWRIDKKKLRQYKDKYENEETRIQDVEAGKGRGRLSLRGFESAFEVIGEQLTEEGEGGIPANATGTAVVGTGDDPTVWKKKKRKNAKVKTEEFGGKKVFVVSPERYWDSRMGKSRYNRYEKYVGNDKLGEAIRLYGRTNPKAPIILKNSENGAMLYLKYGK